MNEAGFPHSDIAASIACTRLGGAFRSVPRPSSAVGGQASPGCPSLLLSTCSEDLDPLACEPSLACMRLLSCPGVASRLYPPNRRDTGRWHSLASLFCSSRQKQPGIPRLSLPTRSCCLYRLHLYALVETTSCLTKCCLSFCFRANGELPIAYCYSTAPA